MQSLQLQSAAAASLVVVVAAAASLRPSVPVWEESEAWSGPGRPVPDLEGPRHTNAKLSGKLGKGC